MKQNKSNMPYSNIPKIRLRKSEDKRVTEVQFRAFASVLPYDIPESKGDYFVCIPANGDRGTVMYCIATQCRGKDIVKNWVTVAIGDRELNNIFIISQ